MNTNDGALEAATSGFGLTRLISYQVANELAAGTLETVLTEYEEASLPVHVVHGNNLGDPDAMHRLAARSNGLVIYHGPDAQLTLAGRRVFLVHCPHYGHAMACTGEWDLVCCGHSHEAQIARRPHPGGGETWLAM